MQIDHPHKIRVDDARLRTVHHPRERQSYSAVWRGASRWLAEHGGAFTHVHFAEYDQLPLVAGFNALQVARLEEERADVLGFQLTRVGRHQPAAPALPFVAAGLPGALGEPERAA